jgi:hypothetical protein
MICTPGRIRTQLPFDLYHRMMHSHVSATEWNAQQVECRQCGRIMIASSLSCHLADVHDIYQAQDVPEELLEDCPSATYTVTHHWRGKLVCPFQRCEGILKNGWNLCHHFWDVHPQDLVVIPSKGKYQGCHWCGMQVNPFYPRHYTMRECQVGVERKH